MQNSEQKIENKKLEKQDKWFLVFSIGTFIIGAFFMLLFVLSYFYPKTNLEIGQVTINGSEHARHNDFIRGESVNFRIGVCKITEIPVEVTVELFDGDKDNVPLINKVSYAKKGCVNMVLVGIIPSTSPTGNYNVRVVAHQQINSRRDAHKEVIIQDIKIVGEDHI